MRNPFHDAAKRDVQNTMRNQAVLIQYLRRKDKTPYGVVVALKNMFGEVRLGYSVPKPGTEYTKHTLLLYAIYRANSANVSAAPTHLEAKKIWDRMVERSSKYFKPVVSPPVYNEGVDWNWVQHWLDRHQEINSTKVFKDV
jgi:hypothetical protein